MTSEIVILITELRNKQRITLPAGAYRFGRSAQCEYVLRRNSVGDHQFTVSYEKDGWVVTDGASDYRTWYNNRYLEPGETSVLQAGDVIGFMGRTGYSTQENVNNIETVHLHFGLQLIFDESQKECDSEIWIDVYPIIELLASHCSSVARDPQTGRWERLYPYCDLDAEPLRSAAAR